MTFKHLLCMTIAVLACAPVLAGPVDVNSADAKTIAQELNGVGVAKARAIVAYRDANGRFRSIAELAQVKGIGVRLLELNRSNIVLGDTDDDAR